MGLVGDLGSGRARSPTVAALGRWMCCIPRVPGSLGWIVGLGRVTAGATGVLQQPLQLLRTMHALQPAPHKQHCCSIRNQHGPSVKET